MKQVYKKLENIEVPDNPTDPKPSEEYVRITFAKGEHGTLEGKTVVDVKKNVEVDLKDNAPEVKPADGWKFSKWSKDLKGKFTEDTTITAEYKKLENIEVPDNPTDPKPSEDYVRIIFAKGEHGTLEGKTAVDVKKNVEVDLKDNAPQVKAAAGWKFNGWNKALKGKFTVDTTITAQYRKLENIEVPDKPTDQVFN